MKNSTGSIGILLVVALAALGIMAFVSIEGVTGKISNQNKVDFKVSDHISAICYNINLQLDREAGRQTPADKISRICPSYVFIE